MPFWKQRGAGQIIANAGANTALSRGTSITASATANTKGAYTQLIASTTYPSHQIIVMFDDCSAGIDYLVDIAVGAAASEQVMIPDLYVGGGTGSIVYGAYYVFNILVDDGVRISARCQASTLSSVVRCSLLLVHGDEQMAPPYSIITAYGINAATSGGVSVDPGAVANTKGAYSQIVASTSDEIDELYLAFGNQKNTTRSSQSWLADLAIGGAGSEQIIIPNIALNCSTSPDIVAPQTFGPLSCQIPIGSRIAVRSQSDIVTATVRLWDFMCYGSH